MRTLKSLQRLFSVQKDLHRLAEFRFAALERQLYALEAEQARLVTYLDDDRLFTLAYTGAIVERLRVIEETRQKLRKVRDEQSQILLEQSRRMGQIRRAVKEVAEEVRQKEAKNELDAAIELAISRQRASFR